MSWGLMVGSFEPAPNWTLGEGRMRALTLEALRSVSSVNLKKGS